MTKARNISEVNKKILDEITKIKAEPKMKQLLKDILAIELDNIDREKFQYKNSYQDAFLRHGY